MEVENVENRKPRITPLRESGMKGTNNATWGFSMGADGWNLS
ncbi:hypothetical protein HMPREF9946_05058 [Acetobacteraceae bacterium AT-5844]|nr:hypothetical protein HMPREF9946_05058 [Acetobacteraceae bacterium AT-5844]